MLALRVVTASVHVIFNGFFTSPINEMGPTLTRYKQSNTLTNKPLILYKINTQFFPEKITYQPFFSLGEGVEQKLEFVEIFISLCLLAFFQCHFTQ